MRNDGKTCVHTAKTKELAGLMIIKWGVAESFGWRESGKAWLRGLGLKNHKAAFLRKESRG
jgi:hypothetical protein